VPGGAASRFFGALAIGQEIDFTGPMGFFVLDLAHPGDVVFGATGTGIAPVLPMLQELAARPAEQGQIHLYWGLRQLEDLFYKDELDALAAAHPRLRWELCISRPPDEAWAAGRRGRITPPVLASAQKLHHPVYYLVGNGGMIDELRACLQRQGIDRKR